MEIDLTPKQNMVEIPCKDQIFERDIKNLYSIAVLSTTKLYTAILRVLHIYNGSKLYLNVAGNALSLLIDQFVRVPALGSAPVSSGTSQAFLLGLIVLHTGL